MNRYISLIEKYKSMCNNLGIRESESEEVLDSLQKFIEEFNFVKNDLNHFRIIFDGQYTRCSLCGNIKRAGFGCYCEDDMEEAK